MSFTTQEEIKSFGGKIVKLQHDSKETKTKMDVNLYLPKQYYEKPDTKLPVLVFLSGLSCTPNNCSEKGFWQPYCNEYGFAMVFPDTSPRGAGVEGEDETYKFGTGAGFYVDATEEKWSKNYRMYSYISKELLPGLASAYSQLDFDNISITGHSMGGYGALMFYFRHPGRFKSVSAFAPISNPSNGEWGRTGFSVYLGNDKSKWAEYDPTELIKKYDGPTTPILIHTGKADPHYYEEHQLLPENLLKASEESKLKGKIISHMEDGYNHSFYFVSSFTKDHAAHHAKYLGLTSKL